MIDYIVSESSEFITMGNMESDGWSGMKGVMESIPVQVEDSIFSLL